MEIYSCNSYLLLCNRLLQNVAAWNSKHLSSHSFCASGIQEWYSWVPLVQGLSCGCSQAVGRAAVLPEDSTKRGSAFKLTQVAAGWLQFLAGHWLEAFPHHMKFSIGLPNLMAPGLPQREWFERGRKGEPKMKAAVFFFVFQDINFTNYSTFLEK